MLTAVTGIKWGDEGKGRVIDLLAENADVVARYQGGNNAGHTVVTEKGKFILNLLPSGILHPDVTCVLGTGMVIDLDHLSNEMQAIEARGVEIGPKNLKLSDKATISMPWHKVQDGLEEDRLAKKGSAFGSTRRGIAYAYSDKYRKKTLRLGDLLHLDEERTQNRLHMILDSKNMELAGCYHQEKMSYDALLDWCRTQAERFAPFICDVGAFLQQAHDSGKRIVLEAQLGAQRPHRLRHLPLHVQLQYAGRLCAAGGRHPELPARPCGRCAESLLYLCRRRPLRRRTCHGRGLE